MARPANRSWIAVCSAIPSTMAVAPDAVMKPVKEKSSSHHRPRQTEQHQRDGQDVLDERRRLAVQPALQIAQPVEMADQTVDEERDRHRDGDDEAVSDLLRRGLRELVVKRVEPPVAGGEQNDQRDDGPGDHFSVILIWMPVSPWLRR